MDRVRTHLARLAAAFALVVALGGGGLAQTAPARPAEPQITELETLLATIEDPAAREKLAGQIRALIAAQRKTEDEAAPPSLGSRLLSALADQVQQVNRSIFGAVAALSDLPALGRWVAAQAQDAEKRADWALLVLKLAAILLAGVIAHRLTGRLLIRPRRTVEARTPRRVTGRVLGVLAFALLDLVPVAAFAAGAYVLMPLIEAGPRTRLVTITLVNAVVISQGIIVLVRAILAPHVAAFRLLRVSDETALYAYIWTRRLTFLTVFGYFATQLASLIGMPSAGARFLLTLVGLTIAALLMVLVLQNRATVARWIRGGEEGAAVLKTLRNRLADIWHVLAGFYIAVIFAVWAFEVPGGFEYIARGTVLSVVILAVARLAAAGIQRGLRRGFAVGSDLKARFPGIEERVNRYVPVINVVLLAALAALAVLALLEAWGLDAFAWLATDVGRRVSGALFSIAVILVLALLVWETATSATERYLSRTDAQGRAIARSQRARTLLPLARTALSAVLLVIVTLVTLSELGVNIGPLLAGAGVVGLAVGFGSQKLVQDVITGAFILIEDSISVGDVVKVGDHAGLVEGISIRTVRLRDLNGNVHTIPFSAVSTVVNMTKEFSYYVLDVGVAYREDTDQVAEVLKAIDEEMRQDARYGPLILAPLEVMGVERFEDSAVIVRARLKTRPIEQWTVGREFNRRMKKRFDELGIEIPFPHVTLYFGADKEGRAPAARVRLDAAGAAEAAPESPKSAAKDG